MLDNGERLRRILLAYYYKFSYSIFGMWFSDNIDEDNDDVQSQKLILHKFRIRLIIA